MCICIKPLVKTLGIILLVVFLLASLTGVILSSLDFDNLNSPSFENLNWRPLSAIQISGILYCLVISILGFVTFCCPYLFCTIFYGILLMLGIISISIAGVLSILGGKYGWLEKYFSCDSTFFGLHEMWTEIDIYLQKADQYLCSPACPCYVTAEAEKRYLTNSTYATIFEQWIKTNQSGCVSFLNCSQPMKEMAYNVSSPHRDTEHSSNQQTLSNYIASLERNYKCSGFCKTTYYDEYRKTNTKISKYLFTDVNNGPPDYLGCYEIYLKALPSYLTSFGAIAIVVAGFQTVIFIFTISLCCI